MRVLAPPYSENLRISLAIKYDLFLPQILFPGALCYLHFFPRSFLTDSPKNGARRTCHHSLLISCHLEEFTVLTTHREKLIHRLHQRTRKTRSCSCTPIRRYDRIKLICRRPNTDIPSRHHDSKDNQVTSESNTHRQEHSQVESSSRAAVDMMQ